jgi:DtxR family Mn-dependent transcriptional regulator
MHRLSITEENYLKAIYKITSRELKGASTNAIADELSTRAASVTDMLKKLHAKKLLHYQPYKAFELTEAGNRTALTVIRKHRLWEYFLVDKLGFDWQHVHKVAEELEHISSTELIDRLDDFLGKPAFDPHGDPIPDSKGKIRARKESSLSLLPVNKFSTVSSIRNQSMEMLEMLNHYKIRIGSKIKVSRRFDFDGSVEVKIEKQAPVLFSLRVAENIFCLA